MLEADVLCGGDSRYYFVRGYVAGSTISKVVDVRWQGGGEFIGLKDDRAPGSSKMSHLSRCGMRCGKNDEQQGRFKDLAQPWLRNALVIAIGIMFFQQFVGINTVIYYSPKIFLMAGFDGAVSAIGASVGVGVVNLLFTLLSVYFVDRLGRRKLYFLGLSGIVISLSLLATSFIFAAQLGDSGKWLSIVLIFLYVGFFAISIGPLGWLIVSEVFPQKLRGLGASLGSLSVWFFNAIVSFTFFKILKVFSIPGTDLTINGESQGNPAGAFLFYAFIGIVAIIWGYFYVPETKGVSLENIEAFLE